jgi:lipoprotein NlpI
MFIVLIIFFAICIGAMIAACIIWSKSPKQETSVKIPTMAQNWENSNDVAKIRSLLKYENISREQRAHLFVINGVYFMKGPFRNLENFSYEELGLLPTNEEMDYEKSKLRIAELETEIERLKVKQSPFEGEK